MANTLGFKYCTKCHLLHYVPTPAPGNPAATNNPADDCAAGGKHEDAAGEYAMRQGESFPGAMPGWQVCSRCKSVVYAIYKQWGCLTQQDHVFEDNIHYVVRTGEESPGMEAGWRSCRKCQSLFWSKAPVPGSCHRGGDHDGVQSTHYALRYIPGSLPDHIEMDWPSIVMDGVAVGGSAHLSIASDGQVTLTWSFHDSGALEYNVSLAFVVWDCWKGVAITVAADPGSVHGTFEPGSRDFGGTKEYHNYKIKENWVDFAVGFTWEAKASATMDAVNIVNNLLSTSLGVAGIVLSVISLGAASPAVGVAAAEAGAGSVAAKALRK